jgi:hypothetical protein
MEQYIKESVHALTEAKEALKGIPSLLTNSQGVAGYESLIAEIETSLAAAPTDQPPVVAEEPVADA